MERWTSGVAGGTRATLRATPGATLRAALLAALAAISTLAAAAEGLAEASAAGPAASPIASPIAGALVGAGATFPAPLYAEWARAYAERTGIAIQYDATGSGDGIERIKRHEVDFAATDAPLTLQQQQEAGLAQFPLVIGGVVPVVNLAGLKPGALQLTGAVLADIYLGKIRKWNDPALLALNPGLGLPNSNITVVHRADASGTTLLWTDYLAKLNPEWRARVGSGTLVEWPTGAAGRGNQGVASYVQRTRMSIGYVEYAYAKQNRLSHAALQNQAGRFVQPGRAGFAAALASAQWTQWAQSPASFPIPTDAPGEASWPITGISFLLLRASPTKAARTREAMKFFSWALASGQAAAERLDYVALPPEWVRQVEQGFQTQVRDAAGKVIWEP